METRKLYMHLKNSAKRRNLDFNLSLTYLNQLSFPISCPILQIPIDYKSNKVQDNSPSIDRIDNNLGYVNDNLQVISAKANRMKNSANDIELKLFARYFNS